MDILDTKSISARCYMCGLAVDNVLLTQKLHFMSTSVSKKQTHIVQVFQKAHQTQIKSFHEEIITKSHIDTIHVSIPYKMNDDRSFLEYFGEILHSDTSLGTVDSVNSVSPNSSGFNNFPNNNTKLPISKGEDITSTGFDIDPLLFICKYSNVPYVPHNIGIPLLSSVFGMYYTSSYIRESRLFYIYPLTTETDPFSLLAQPSGQSFVIPTSNAPLLNSDISQSSSISCVSSEFLGTSPVVVRLSLFYSSNSISATSVSNPSNSENSIHTTSPLLANQFLVEVYCISFTKQMKEARAKIESVVQKICQLVQWSPSPGNLLEEKLKSIQGAV